MKPVAAVSWAIEHRAVFDFLAPPCLDVTDPEFRTINLICDLVQNRPPDKAGFSNLDHIARHAAESTNRNAAPSDAEVA